MLLDSTGEGIYGADEEGRCTFANQACLRMLGFERVDELLGRNMHHLIHNHHADGRDYPIEECSIFLSHKTGQAMHSAEEVFWTKHGVAIPIEFWSYPILDGDVNRGVVVIFQDAAVRRTAAEDKARLVAIVDGTADAIIGRSLNGQIDSWNQGAENVYGYTAREAIGKPIALILPEGKSLEEPELAVGILQTGGIRQFITTRRRKDGNLITVSITASPIHDLTGQVVGTATIERDVTEMRLREQELLAAKEQADAANHIKSEFVANISHELRTPMNAILGMIDVVRRSQELPSRLRDYLGTAHDSAKSMLSLVNDLLDFSRLDAGRLELVNGPFSLRETLDEAMRVLALRARDRGLELACHVRHDVPDELTGDGRRLRQVVMNLVGNAIKFTPEGEVIVHATVESLEADRLQLRISVVDTGVGIEPALQREIFQPFAQVDASDTRSHAGSGLGLSISKRIVELMGGRIWCESNTGPGMTFHTLVNLGVRQRQPGLETTTATHLRNRSVLVIDSHQSTREILTELIAAWGMSPHLINRVPTDPLELLDDAKQAGCEVIILDAGLVESDGKSLVDGLQQAGVLQRTILLIPPGELGSEVVKNWQAAGAAAFVEKPVSQSDLLEAIIRTLGEHSTVGTATWLAPAAAPRSLNLLIAEDILANQKVVRSILELRGHTVEIANNGVEAVERASRRRFDAILMDIRMPLLQRDQRCRQIRNLPGSASQRCRSSRDRSRPFRRSQTLSAGRHECVRNQTGLMPKELIRSVEIVTASIERGKPLQQAARARIRR
ncbi:MAG: PAS domain S-box protein [Planctomycetaceae bacterium]